MTTFERLANNKTLALPTICLHKEEEEAMRPSTGKGKRKRGGQVGGGDSQSSDPQAGKRAKA